MGLQNLRSGFSSSQASAFSRPTTHAPDCSIETMFKRVCRGG
jgi:hypothetical protein